MKTISKFRRILLIAGGILCVILGTIGIFLPILPTTIFFLLAAAAFARSSDRLYNWIMNHRLFGRFIRNYRLYHAVPMASKIVSVAFLWLTIGASVLFAVQLWWLRALLLLIAIGVSWHILALKTLTHEMQSEIDKLDAAKNIAPKNILPEA
ncbi:MAG: YbaN family protein [Anaerolineaceae bacterium]|nr:YbaN family protein [Anaerolineaceae bacterium]